MITIFKGHDRAILESSAYIFVSLVDLEFQDVTFRASLCAQLSICVQSFLQKQLGSGVTGFGLEERTTDVHAGFELREPRMMMTVMMMRMVRVVSSETEIKRWLRDKWRGLERETTKAQTGGSGQQYRDRHI